MAGSRNSSTAAASVGSSSSERDEVYTVTRNSKKVAVFCHVTIYYLQLLKIVKSAGPPHVQIVAAPATLSPLSVSVPQPCASPCRRLLPLGVPGAPRSRWECIAVCSSAVRPPRERERPGRSCSTVRRLWNVFGLFLDSPPPRTTSRHCGRTEKAVWPLNSLIPLEEEENQAISPVVFAGQTQ